MSYRGALLLLGLTTLQLLLTTGCCRSGTEVWDDTRTCSRHIGRGFRSLGGKRCNSRQVLSRQEFCPMEDEWCELPDSCCAMSQGSYEDPLAMVEYTTPPPRQSPGDPGSGIPGIDAFQSPKQQQRWSGVFRNVSFDYNSNLIRGDDNKATLKKAAGYMKSNPRTVIFVEGHCDERGGEAYNLSLGARRANAVRSALINEGVNGENIFTISYGKERPIALGHDEQAWQQNRRAEFKVYEK